MGIRTDNFLSGVLGGAVTGLILTYLVFSHINPAIEELQSRPSVISFNDSTGPDGLVTAIVENTKDSVVHIQSAQEISTVPGHPTALVGTGTGMVISEEGYILTNYHVIEDASDVKVTFASGETVPATFVGSDPLRDVAVLEVDTGSPMQPVTIGNSSDLKPGQFVMTIGNPYGLDQTVTTGIISALDRRLRTKLGFSIGGVIQTDTVINPGNSGGPLLNSKGEVIGITSAIFSTDEGFQGIGFAIPINEVMAATEDLITYGRVVGPSLGVVCTDAGKEFSDALNLEYDGVLLLCVQPGSPLEDAGLRGTVSIPGTTSFILGDIVIEVAGERVYSLEDIANVLSSHEAGDRVEIQFVRDGRLYSTEAVLN